MKKIVLILIMFTLIMTTVNAATTEEFYPAEWINNTFINKVKNGVTHYRQARFIRKNSDKGVAYCIEPFETMKENEKYNGYDDAYAKRLGISEATWKKISLIAYYGFGYSNHITEKWYAITQIMIWREVDKNADFYFTDGLNGKKTNKYDSEIQEITSLVNNHSILPSFANKAYNYSINSINEIIDTNSVLNTFNVVSKNDSIELQKNNNKLIITTKENTNEVISFEKQFKNYNKQAFVFVDSSYQNVMTPGNVENLKFDIKLQVNSGRIKITKVDGDTLEKAPNGEGILIGSTYNLYDINNKVIDTLVINEDNEAISNQLPYGKYILKEEKSMNGYLLDDNKYEFEINSNNLSVDILLKNKPIKSTVEIYKYFDEKLESGISFEIYNNKGEIIDTVTTNEEGYISKELYYGTYTFHQLNTTKNYQCVEDFKVTIDENTNSTIRLDLKDEKFSTKLVITKKDKNTGKVITEETVFKIYDVDNNRYIEINGSNELKTKEGILKIEKIQAGRYKLEEFKPPKGYKKLDKAIEFIVDDEEKYKYEDGFPVLELEVYDEVLNVKVPNTSQNIENSIFELYDKKRIS